MATSDLPDRAGIRWLVGARLEAQDVTLKWYRAKIVDIKESKKQVMVHFDGWNSRWDDWFPMESERLRPCSKIQDWRDKKREKKSLLKVNQRVLARWKTLSMYPARITAVNNDGSYRVVFHDGIKQNVSGSNVKPATADELNKIEKEIESRQWLAPQVVEGRRPRKPCKADDSFIMTEPIVRRRSSEKGESSQPERRASGEKKPERPPSGEKKPERPPTGEKKVERPVKVENSSPAAILRQLKKKRKYLKLGEAIPDKSGAEKKSPPTKRPVESTSAEATEESYDTFKASISTKRKRTASHHSSGRSSATDELENQSATDVEDIDQSDGRSDTSPRKIKVKSTLHAKMARVREVCNKWKREKEKKVMKKSSQESHSPMLLSDAETTDPVPVQQEELLVTPSTSTFALATSTPLSVAIETGVSTLETVTGPLTVSLTRLDVDTGGQKSPATGGETTNEGPSTPLTPLTPATPATPITPITPITPSTPDPPSSDNRNKYPCAHCSRGFRKENLLNYHLKYYHSDETSGPLESSVPADELASARKKPDPIKREDRKRSRDEAGDHPRHPLFIKRRSEEGVRSGNMLIDTKRPSTGSYTTESDLDSSMNQPDLSSSSHFNLEFNTTSDMSREIKQERRDSVAMEESFVSDSEISIKTERERYDSFGVDSIVSEDQESVAGEERREEVINCPCGFTEENGLMIQCEICLCWQHVICIRLSEDKLPVKYICWVCTNPPGVRDTMRHIHDQDWLKEGQLTRFSYLARTRESMRRVPVLKALSGLVSDVYNIREVLTGLKKTAVVAGEESPELDSVYASLEAALAHGTVPQLPERGLTDGDREERSMAANKDSDVRFDSETTTTTTTHGQSDQNDHSSAPGTNNTEGAVSGANNTTSDVPKENGDSLAIDASETNGFSNESDSSRPINGPSALSDHSYLQTGDRRNAVTFRNSHHSNHEVNSTRDGPTSDDVKLNEAQRNVNLYISAQQDLIDERLDLMEQQISGLEDLDAGQPLHVEYDPLADVVGVKKCLRGLIQDLQKVKRMATYSVNRR